MKLRERHKNLLAVCRPQEHYKSTSNSIHDKKAGEVK